MSLRVLSERSGHSGLAITADVYTAVLEDMDRQAADTAAAFILGSR